MNRSKQYDLIVIGAGAAGIGLAETMRTLDFSVLLIDKDERSIGGDCLNHGCIPSKSLIRAATLVENARQATQFGLSVGGAVDLARVRSFVEEKIETIRTHENTSYFRNLGIDVALGRASFVSERTVRVSGKVYGGRRIVIATGSSPRMITVPGIEQVDIIHTNETIFDLTELPIRLLIIGAGPIGVEIGQAYAKLGSAVTMVAREKRFLPRFEASIASILEEELVRNDIDLRLGHTLTRFEDGHTAIFTDSSGNTFSIAFDSVLVAIGRKPNIEGLSLDTAGIETEGDQIVSDDFLRTTNRHVYVAGDVSGRPQFTHAAELQVRLLISNFFSPIKRRIDFDHLSWVMYSHPEIASFGLSAETLDERGVSYERIEHDFTWDDRAIIEDNRQGKLILYLKKKKILGGTLIGRHAGELVQELILANTYGLSIDTLIGKIYPYPTAGRVNQAPLLMRHLAWLKRFSWLLKRLY